MNPQDQRNSPITSPHWSSQPIIDWLFSEGRLIEIEAYFVGELAQRLSLSGAPVDRLMITMLTLNPQVVSVHHTWLKSDGKTTTFEANHGIRETDRYIGSPLQQLFDSGRKVRQRLDRLPLDAHLAYTELAEQGYIDYLALPVHFGKVLGCAIIIATRVECGFSNHDIENFRQIRSFLAPILEVYSLRHQSVSLLNTYVGKRTGGKILAGMIRRGDADTIHAALWLSDLRDFTRLTETLSTQQILDLLNEYFEVVSEAVTARGGEILRFIGDAMLIVFPIDDRVIAKSACRAAIGAAIDAQASLETLNFERQCRYECDIRFGVGLNIGEVIYGNVGAVDRLDFTVMGPAVNRTARLESLTKTLGSSILFSRDFADLLDRPTRFLGDHEMKGIEQPQAVFALDTE